MAKSPLLMLNSPFLHPGHSPSRTGLRQEAIVGPLRHHRRNLIGQLPQNPEVLARFTTRSTSNGDITDIPFRTTLLVIIIRLKWGYNE
jgi:hypothetical protein